MTDTTPIRVAIADDQALLRGSLRALLASEEGIEVLWEASSGPEALSLCAEAVPDVLLLDIRMPGGDGLSALHQIRALHGRSIRILMLTMYEVDEYLRQALSDGADGYLLKDSAPEDLIAAVHGAVRGEPQMSPAVLRTLMASFARGPASARGSASVQGSGVPAVPLLPGEHLTPREYDVLALIAEGLSNEEIERQLVISRATLKTHIAALRRKTGVNDRVKLALLGVAAQVGTPGCADTWADGGS